MTASRFECPRCQTVFVKDIAGDAAFVECPSCGALALPAGDATEGALERALSGPQAAPARNAADSGLASTEAEQPAAEQDPAAPAPGMFANLLDGAQSNPGGEPVRDSGRDSGRASVSSSPNAPELGFDFGDINLDIPLPPPPTRSQEGAPINDGMGADSGKFRAQNAAVHALPPEALQKLAEDADAGPTNAAKPAPWSGLSEEAFGDLEKAFDEMALKPVPPGHGRGLSTDEERFLRGDEQSGLQNAPGGRPPPLRRVEGERTDRAAPPRPPPKGKQREKRPRPTHFELSVEARRLAFLPIDREGSVSMPRPRPAAEPAATRSRPPEPSTSMPRPVMATGSTVETSEETDLVRNRENAERRKPVPSAFRGLTAGRAAALVVVATLLGAGGGAMMAPKPKAAATARQRAELRFADGNRFYDAGRFDDALGAFRGALSIDPTFALAHRAKGAALAKLSRFDEAAEAYDEYLKLEPSAVDAPDVKNAIVRRRGPDKPADAKP